MIQLEKQIAVLGGTTQEDIAIQLFMENQVGRVLLVTKYIKTKDDKL